MLLHGLSQFSRSYARHARTRLSMKPKVIMTREKNDGDAFVLVDGAMKSQHHPAQNIGPRQFHAPPDLPTSPSHQQDTVAEVPRRLEQHSVGRLGHRRCLSYLAAMQAANPSVLRDRVP